MWAIQKHGEFLHYRVRSRWKKSIPNNYSGCCSWHWPASVTQGRANVHLNWSLPEWLMSFQSDKCEVLKIGRPISELTDLFDYCTLRVHKLEVVQYEKDIWIVINCDLSFYIHLAQKIKKATRLGNILRRSLMCLCKESFLCQYNSIEYTNQIWVPRLEQIDT